MEVFIIYIQYSLLFLLANIIFFIISWQVQLCDTLYETLEVLWKIVWSL